MQRFTYPKAMELEIMDMHLTINNLNYRVHKQSTENHLHSYYELHYITSGHIEFRIDFHEKVLLGANDWLLLGNNVFHEETLLEDCSGYCIGIEMPDTSSPVLCALGRSRYHMSHDDQGLFGMLRAISSEMEQTAPGYGDYCRGMLTLILIRVFRHCLPDQVGTVMAKQKYYNTRNIIDDFFNRFYRGIRDHFSIEDLAEKLSVSPRHILSAVSKKNSR